MTNAALIAEGRAAAQELADDGNNVDAITVSRLCDALAVREGFVLVPREPTEAMLQGACKGHKPGVPMSANREEECPKIGNRRYIWNAMIAAAGETGA